MKKFRLRQEVSATEEDGTKVKEISVDMWVSTEGISEDTIKDMFELFSNGFTGLIEEVSFAKNNENEMEFMIDDMKEDWQRWQEQV